MEISSKNENCWDRRIEFDSFNKLTTRNIQDLAGSGQYLIVTADDFGYDERRDEGILESFTKGIVTRASLLVNGASAKTTAVSLAKENNIPLGLHINLTEGKPIYDTTTNNTLTNENGFMRGKFGFREALTCDEIDMKNVKDEVNAQIKTFIQLVGTIPNHVDGHQHVHILPGIRDIIAEYMQSYSIQQIRIPLEDFQKEWFDLSCEFYSSVCLDARKAVKVYTSHGIRFPEKFFGISLIGKCMSLARIMDAVCEQDGTTTFCEFMVHPGYACINDSGGCGNGPDKFACSTDREHEAKVLQSLDLRRMLHDNGVTLIS